MKVTEEQRFKLVEALEDINGRISQLTYELNEHKRTPGNLYTRMIKMTMDLTLLTKAVGEVVNK